MTGQGVYELPDRRPAAPVVLATAVGNAAGSLASAAALTCAGSEPDRAGLLIDLTRERAARPTPIATAGARALEQRLAAHLPDAAVASRGAICQANVELDSVPALLPLARESVAVLHLPPALLQPALDDPRIRPSGALLRADLATDRALTALAARDLIDRGLRLVVVKQSPSWLTGRLALIGTLPSGALPTRSPRSSMGSIGRLLGTEDKNPRHCYDGKDGPEDGRRETQTDRGRP